MKRLLIAAAILLLLLSGCGEKEAPAAPQPAEVSIAANETFAFSVTNAAADSDGGIVLTARCENRSDKALLFSWEHVSVNDYMIDPLWTSEVSAGKKSIEKIVFGGSELSECGIQEPAEIAFDLSVRYADNAAAVQNSSYTLILKDGLPSEVKYGASVTESAPTAAEDISSPEPTEEPAAPEGIGERIFAGGDKIVWLHSDGTVTGAGFVDGHVQELKTWSDITDVAVASSHAMGLRSDGTIAQVGGSSRLDTKNLANVTHIAAGKDHSVVIHENGSCSLYGYSSQLVIDCFHRLDHITQASIGSAHSAAMDGEGNWFVAGSAAYGKENLSWNLPIAKLICGGDHTVALNDNGSVVATGANNYGQCETSGWKNIVDVAAGALHTVGLRSDGTVVAAGHNKFGQCEVNGWSDIVAIACGDYMTVGVQSDGKVLVAYANNKTDDTDDIARTWVLKNPVRTPGLDF